MIASLLLIGLLAPQSDGPPEDPLREVVELEVDEEGVGREFTLDQLEHGGTLNVFARSDAIDMQLLVHVDGAPEPLEASGESGGPSAFVRVDVEPGDGVALVVHSKLGQGAVELAWCVTVETDATLEAAGIANEELKAFARLAASGAKQEAREGLTALIDFLASVEGGDRSQAVGEGLYRCGGMASALGILEPARIAHLHAEAARARRLPSDHVDLLFARETLATVSARLGDAQTALPLFRAVLAGRVRIVPPDHVDIPNAKLNVATALRTLGRMEEAIALTEEVYETLSSSRPADDFNVVYALFSLGSAYLDAGDSVAATPMLESAYAIWKEKLRPDDPNFLLAQMNLALALRHTGDSVGAAELEEHVYARRKATLPPDHPSLHESTGNLITMRLALGDLDSALVLSEEALGNCRQHFDGDHPRILEALHRVAWVRQEMGDLAIALELGEDVLRRRQAIYPPDHQLVIRSKSQVATTRFRTGDLLGARALEEQVLEHYIRTTPSRHPSQVRAKLSLGATLFQFGEYAKALPLFEASLAARRALPASHPDRLSALINMSAVHAALGDEDGCLEVTGLLVDGLAARADELRTEPARIARAAARLELGRLSPVLQVNTSLASPLVDRIFEALEALRHVSTASADVASAVRRFPDLRKPQARVRAARRALQGMSLAAPTEAKDIPDWETALVELAAVRERADRDLRKAMTDLGVTTSPPSLDELRNALGPRSVLASFLRYRGRPPIADPETGAVAPVDDRLVAFVVRRDGPVRRLEIGSMVEIDELVTGWRDAIGTPILARGEAPSSERGVSVASPASDAGREAAVGAVLRSRLIDPCLAGLEEGEVDRLHMVLDDVLHLLPFDALPAKDGTPLGDHLDIRIEPATRRLVSPPRPPSGGVLVAVGGVDYGTRRVASPEPSAGWRSSPRSERAALAASFDPLAFTIPEIEAVAELFAGTTEESPVVLTGADATKQALTRHAEKARYLHVATHGWFVDDAPMAQDKGAGSSQAAAARTARTLRGFAPETLCGLALAGANGGVDESGQVVGILTAEELAAIDLSDCELAVLSACETNVGIRRAGQGIQSLQSAVHAAGARTAITSLWKVDDAATRDLMELLYTNLWVKEMPKAEALWSAKTTLRRAGHPIRNWAGWALTGDPE